MVKKYHGESQMPVNAYGTVPINYQSINFD